MWERRESLPRSTAPSRLQAHRPANPAHSSKQSRGISNVPPPSTWEEGEGKREGSFRHRDTQLCPYDVRDGMTQRGAMPAPPYHPWGQWQPPMSLTWLEGHHKQSALGWVADKDVWNNEWRGHGGWGARSGQLISNLVVLIGYKFILPPNPLWDAHS